jgi:hypothetical protein
MSFELELLWLRKDGQAIVVDREQCPLDLSLAKLKAQHVFDERRANERRVDAVRIRDPSGREVFVYRDTMTRN